MYYYRVNPTDGFGISRVYTDDGYEENVTIRDHVMQMMPEGYHTVVSAPGYTTYFLWFLAGAQRTQGAREDAALAWVGQTVPTLRSLGLQRRSWTPLRLDGRVAMVTSDIRGMDQMAGLLPIRRFRDAVVGA